MLTALLPALLLAVAPAAPQPAAASPAAAASVVPARTAEAVARPVARLRKLHLVRPDLIPYPLAYEVYC